MDGVPLGFLGTGIRGRRLLGWFLENVDAEVPAMDEQLPEMVPHGLIGKAVPAYAAHSSNMYPEGIANEPPEDLPTGLDWDMWLGPGASREYQANTAPAAITAEGGKHALTDDRTIPDTMTVLYEFESSAAPKTSGLPTARRPTTCYTTSTAGPGAWTSSFRRRPSSGTGG